MYTGMGAAIDVTGATVLVLDPASPTVNSDLAAALRAGETVNVGAYCFGPECPGPLTTINGAASRYIYALYEYLPDGMPGYPTAAATYYDGTIRDRVGTVLGIDPALQAILVAQGLGPFPVPPASANGTEVHVALVGGVGSAPGVTLVNQATAQAKMYASAPNQVTLSPGVSVPASAILDGPTTLPDGVIVTAYTTAQGQAIFYAVPGPLYKAPGLVPGAVPVGLLATVCGWTPGTGGWYVGNALGYNCPQPPAGYTGGYDLLSATMRAAWAQMLSDVSQTSGVPHDMTNSTPLPGGVALGTADFQLLGSNPNPQANGAPLLAPLTSTGANWPTNDVSVTVVPGAMPASSTHDVIQPAVTTAPETDESGTLDVQVVPYTSPTPTGGSGGTMPTADSSSAYTPSASPPAMTGNTPTLGNGGLLLGLGALLVVAAVAGKKRS